ACERRALADLLAVGVVRRRLRPSQGRAERRCKHEHGETGRPHGSPPHGAKPRRTYICPVGSRGQRRGERIMRRFALIFALAFSTAAVLVGSAGSAHSRSSFQVFVEETTSASANGLTLVSELEGTYNVVGKTASGGGTYEVWAGSTELDHGTFTLTRLITFQFYGCGEVTGEDG